MKTYVGIDLGSTTSKAIILDDNGEILGRGITNSRSNYEMASSVARSEAYVNAKFTLFRRALADRGGSGGSAEELERSFRLEQYFAQLRLLEKFTNLEVEGPRYVAVRAEATPRLEQIFAGMREQAPRFFDAGARRKSDFFRDIAGGSFQAHAEKAADPKLANYSMLLSLYDKAILRVENEPVELGFDANIGPALVRVLSGASDAQREACRAATEYSTSTVFNEVRAVGTGYGRARLPFPKDRIRSEILCHGLGAHAMFENTRTVLDIGGQDTKAIQVDKDGIVTSFQMNDRCAAGCGRYLGYIADEMNLGLHELGPLAQTATRTVRISSTCTVFAGAELRERLSLGEKREDILSGLHRSIILRAMSLLARSGGVEDEFTFTGGVANNAAAVDALRALVKENYGERRLNISPNSIYTGALGAALFSRRDAMTEAKYEGAAA
ncbi:MAG: benzoyl-CoA reductase subunit A [Planctomycetes bacterium]|nr:benzoyl-CoA reductase subunit A [Planctomycetota bacterium]